MKNVVFFFSSIILCLYAFSPAFGNNASEGFMVLVTELSSSADGSPVTELEGEVYDAYSEAFLQMLPTLGVNAEAFLEAIQDDNLVNSVSGGQSVLVFDTTSQTFVDAEVVDDATLSEVVPDKVDPNAHFFVLRCDNAMPYKYGVMMTFGSMLGSIGSMLVIPTLGVPGGAFSIAAKTVPFFVAAAGATLILALVADNEVTSCNNRYLQNKK